MSRSSTREGATGPGRYRPPRATVDPDQSLSWIRRAWPLLKAHRLMFGVSLGTSMAALVVQVQIPDLLSRAIDDALVHGAAGLGALQGYVWWIAAMAVGFGLLMFCSRLYLFRTAYRIEYDLRHIVYQHLVWMSFAFYDKSQTGQLISRANSDIRQVQMFLAFAPSILVQCGVAVVAFIYMLSINVVLAFAAMITLPMVYFVAVWMRREMFPVSWLIQTRLADVATIVDENVNGVRIVKSFAAEGRQLRSLAKAANGVQWAYTKDADIRAKWSPLVENLPRMGLALILLIGGWMAYNGQTTVGAIVAFNAYLLMVQPPFRMLGMIIMMSQRAAASAGRIYEVLDTAPDIADRADARDLVDCQGDVRFEDIHFDYPAGTHVLNGFDLHVPAGETVAIVGATGTGKSTVARLLARCYDVDSGAVRVDGHDVRDLTLRSLRDNVGLVFDEPFLFSVSVRDNIAYGRPDATLDEIVEAAKVAGAHEFVERLDAGYDTVVGERGYTLSGGQRQRIAIARAVLLNRPILVLDDATSAIDVALEEQIHGSLRRLMVGRTTLIIAHRLSTISLADRVVLVDGGRVVGDGTHTELLASTPRYAEVLAQAEELDRVLHAEAARDEGEDSADGLARDAVRAGAGRGARAGRGAGSGDPPPAGDRPGTGNGSDSGNGSGTGPGTGEFDYATADGAD